MFVVCAQCVHGVCVCVCIHVFHGRQIFLHPMIDEIDKAQVDSTD